MRSHPSHAAEAVRRLLCGAFVCGLTLAAGGSASAAVLDVAPGATDYRAAPGEKNKVVVATTRRRVTYTDTGADIELKDPGNRCERRSVHEVACARRPTGRTDFHLGDQADFVSFEGAPGSFTFTGGSGTDEVSYSASGKARSVRISLDGRANDGVAGDRSNVGGDVENVTLYGAGTGSRVIGSNARNFVFVTGPVTVLGGGGGDRLAGEGTFHGGNGPDTITAWGAGAYYGDGGDDRLSNAFGTDGDGRKSARFFGGPGRDRIDASNSNYVPGLEEEGPHLAPLKDWVYCGSARDTVVADARDVVARDCESTKRL